MSIDKPLRLGGLPDKLLNQILDTVSCQRDLYALCLVSRRLNRVADPLLYKSLIFNQPRHHVTFTESLARRPRRGSLIQSIRLKYTGSELESLTVKDNRNRIDRFSSSISTMSNLEKLVISVPDSLCHGIGNLFNGPFDLACLKSCSLSYEREDGGYWDLQENIHIFSHPTLEHLTIRRARLDERGFDSLEKPSETALQELHFIECDINDDALGEIIFHPDALKVVTMTQSEEPYPPLEESPEDIEDYILALRSASHSIESIAIDFPSLGCENALRMRDFQQATSLKLRDYQLFGESSNSPRLNSVGLPPLLRELEFYNTNVGEDEEILELLCSTIDNKHLLARDWRELIVSGDNGQLPRQIIEACNKASDLKLRYR